MVVVVVAVVVVVVAAAAAAVAATAAVVVVVSLNHCSGLSSTQDVVGKINESGRQKL